LGQICCIPTGAKGGARRSQVGPGILGGNGLRMVTYKRSSWECCLALVLQVLRKVDDSLVEKLRKKLRLGFRV